VEPPTLLGAALEGSGHHQEGEASAITAGAV